MKYSLLAVLVLLLAHVNNVSHAQTQRYKFTRINQLGDESLGEVNAIAEDEYGFIWFSEAANGALTRFDGFNLKRYLNIPGDPNSLGGASPECLFIDRDGYIWIGFIGQGMDRFDPLTETFTHFRHDPNDENSLSNDWISSIVGDAEGNIYVATFGGLDIYDSETGTFTHFRHNPEDSTSLSSNFIRKIYIDRKGIVWVGTGWFGDPDDMGGLNRFDKNSKTFTRYMAEPKDPAALINRRVTAILEDSKGNFWVGTGGDGLHSMDRSSGKFTRHSRSPDAPNILSAPITLDNNGYAYGVTFLAEDLSGNLWIGAQGFNVYDPDQKTMTHFGNNKDYYDTFIENSAWCIHIGSNGMIWISTQPGVYKIDPYNFTIPKVDDVIPSYLKESDSISWSGLHNGLIRENHNDGSKLRFIHDPKNPNTISNNSISTIHRDQNGVIWVGTNNGLNKLEFEKGRITSFVHNPKDSSSISNNVIVTMTNDNNGVLWVGTRNGLNKWDRSKERFEMVKIPSSGRYNFGWIQSLESGANDELWIAQFENTTLVKINTKTGALESFEIGNGISDLLKDALGRIWVASPSGLYRYNEEQNNFDIIANRPMFAMVEDADSTLWVSSTSHLFRKKLMSENLIQYIGDYVVRAGSILPMKVGGYINFKGEIHLGDNKDYYVFNPKSIHIPHDSARVHLTNFWVGEELIQSAKSDLLTQSIMEAGEVHLTYDQNTFSFSSTEIDLRNPGRNKIMYMLEDYDLNWRETFAEEKVTYLNVPPGQYIFRIKAPNSSTGMWGEKHITVNISPPWWRTSLAYMLYLFAFAGFLFAADRFQRNRILKREQEKAQRIELEHAREIEEAYENLKATQAQLIQSEKMASLGELTAGIAHEIKNPLNFVNNFSEINAELADELLEALTPGSGSGSQDIEEAIEIAIDIKSNEEKIMHHGKRADSIVKNMLQHSRVGSAEKQATDINALADEYLRLAYHGLRAKDSNFNCKMETDLDDTIGKVNVIPQDFGRVLLNLITNAFQACALRQAQGNAERNRTPISKKLELENYSPCVKITTKVLPQSPDRQAHGDISKGGNGSASNNDIEIRVSDNGSGIPDDIKDKIFQPFFTTKPTGEGTGLGLSMSYDIVTKGHGGTLEVESEEGKGTEFKITLPIV